MIKQKVFSLNFGDSEIEDNQNAYELFTKTYKDGLFLLDKMTRGITKIGVPVLLGSNALAIDIDTDELFAYKLFDRRGLPFDVKLARTSRFNKVQGSLIIDDQTRQVIYFGNVPDDSEYAEYLLQMPNIITPESGIFRANMDQPDPLRARGRRSNYVHCDYPYGEQKPARYIDDKDGSPLELVPMGIAYKEEEDEESKYRGGESDGGGSSSSWGDDSSSSNDDNTSNGSGSSDD